MNHNHVNLSSVNLPTAVVYSKTIWFLSDHFSGDRYQIYVFVDPLEASTVYVVSEISRLFPTILIGEK